MIRKIKEIEIIAPYAENEEVKSTHLSYCDYHNPTGSPGDAEVDCHNMDSYKNILARSYFYGFTKVEKVTIGEGYEYIGSMAFYNYPILNNSPNGAYHIANFDWNYNHTELRQVILPETLKGVGFFAFGNHCRKEGLDINLPQSLEYIDGFSFYYSISLNADVDLPNLKVLGTHAFFVSGVRNVHLYDKLEYIGHSPFQSCHRLNDVIIDFDVFNPDKNTGGLLTEAAFASAMFGHIQAVYPLEGVSDELKAIIGNLVPTAAYGEHTHKLGNIIFTEKVQTAPRQGWWTFYGTAAAKLDLSKTGWKVIPAYSFCNTAFDELLLPEGTTEIGYGAFVRSRIEEEVVIPETVKTIAANAFDNRAYHDYNNAYWDGEHTYVNGEIDDTFDCKFDNYQGNACTFSHGVKITSLPTGIESIGRDAFSYDNRFTADVNLPNITTLEDNAFMGTSTKNITLGSNLQSIGRRVFTGIGQIDNLTIDCDIASIYHGYAFNFMTDLFNEDVEHGMGNWYYTDIDDMSDIRQNEAKVRIGKLTIGNHATTVPDLGEISMPYYRILEPVEGAEMDEYGYCVDQTYSNYNNKCYRVIEERQWENVATSLFYGVIADEIDMSAAQWTTLPERAFHSVKAGTLKLPATLTIIPKNAFYDAEIENLTIPDSVTTIDKEAFEYAEIDSFVGLPEGVTTIGEAAFYGASLGGNFVVPTTVNSIGLSAFNAGDADTHYDTVTIKPTLDYEKTNNQAVFQMFWNATIDKLVIESSMLPVLGTLQDTPILPDEIEVNGEMVSPLRDDGEPEFHAMTMKEVVIKNLPVITANAFEDCANLEKVDLSGHDNLQEIAEYAFSNDAKLKKFVFGDDLKGKNVDLKTFAFSNTAIETIGREDSDFDLSAANFNAVRISVFSNMPKLKSVDIPSTFSINPALANAELHTNGSTIPASTFADDPELEEVTLDYQLSKVADGAFLGDDKITKLFVWGNTEIEETDDFKNATGNTTIPQVTNIFAYSDAPAENYANADSRSNYEGKFYPLDEVLYLTTNKIYVILEQDEEGNNVDFNKEGLILYALRRDGVILESDNWQEYTMAFPRATNPSIRFEQGRGGNLGTDENLIWNVYDAKKPFETISLANENYAETSFEFMQMPSSNNPMILIHYPDGYTGNVRTATLASMTKEEEQKRDEELNVPNTGVFHTVSGVVVASFSISAFVILGTMLIVKKTKK